MALTPLAITVLALLNERPMHPYEMHQLLLARRVDRVVKVRPGRARRGGPAACLLVRARLPADAHRHRAGLDGRDGGGDRVGRTALAHTRTHQRPTQPTGKGMTVTEFSQNTEIKQWPALWAL